MKAQEMLRIHSGACPADVWSVTSWTQLRRDALAAERDALLDPGAQARVPYVTQALQDAPGPVVAVSDYMRAVQDQIRPFVSADFISPGHRRLGTSDTPWCAAPALPGGCGVDHDSNGWRCWQQSAQVDPERRGGHSTDRPEG